MEFSLEALEYPRLKAVLARYVRSEAGRARLEALGPGQDRARLEARHGLVREAMDYLREHAVSFADIPLLPGVLERLPLAGVTLEIPEIEALQDFLSEAQAFRARWGPEDGFPRLAEKGRAMPDLKGLARELGRAVRGGEIDENYSPALKRLRQEIEKARARLNRKLESMVRSEELSDQLQDQLVTMRNGRYVIPVRVEQKRRVAGIVHGTSSSGATVFMEPLETLEMNNDLVRLQEEEAREVQRILGELTDRIQESADDLGRTAGLWTELEVLFGVARWGRDFDCAIPRFSAGEVRLRGARHPLLDDRLRAAGGAITPLDLMLAAGERTLVISGPNAGGKTIVLKTLGLFSLMAQSGLPVPADEAVLPLADRILADIGDQQSIANQLSTFSAHVLAISRMVEAATADSLILLDEIGSSTEPAEGAALATAVLDHFRTIGARTVATTHYNRLKMYAETTAGVRNAAMEFNEATLEPTYRLIHGLAGQSSGLKIAERLKLPPALLATARAALDRSELDAARYVEELKARVASLERDTARLEGEKREFERWQQDMTARIAAERRDEIDRVEKRLDQIVGEIRDRSADALKVLSRESAKRFERTLERVRADAGRALQEERRKAEPAAVKTPAAPAPPAAIPPVGARVRVASLGVEGVVTEVRDGEVHVAAGHMKMRRPASDLELIAPPLALPKNVRLEVAEKDMAGHEINLIGCTADEAVDRLDKFLDDAFLARLPFIRIVHGSGMGVLRKAVARLLEGHPHVTHFEAAPSSQGGAGATIATLKE